MRPLLSLVIPTKNRYEYLTKSLDSLVPLKEKYGELLEIVVQDNSTSNEDFVPYLNNPPCQFRYFYIPEHLSVVDNCNKAILNSTGEFVCFNGDDDTVTSEILNIVKWMKSRNIDSCHGTIIRYNWPDLLLQKPFFHSITIPKLQGVNKLIDTRKEVERVIENGATSILNLPKVYHGIVSRAMLDRVYSKAYSFFPGPSPDMANAIALGLVVDRHMVIDMPFIISGFSAKSTGGQAARHAHKARIEDRPNLPKETALLWDKRNPRYWTVQTVWAESAIKSLQKMGREDLVSKFNFTALYAAFTVFNINLFKYCKSYISFKNVFPYVGNMIKEIVNRGKIFINRQAERRLKIEHRYIVNNIQSLLEAYNEADTYIAQKHLEIPDVD